MYRLLTLAFLMAVCLVQLFAPWPRHAAAEGALAVGITGDVAKDGYSIGIAYNIKTEEEARQGALDHCRKTGSPATKPKCAIVATFHLQCAAEAEDPQAGTPGAGWGIGPDKDAAEKIAMSNCAATAGTGREKFCKVVTSKCDGQKEEK